MTQKYSKILCQGMNMHLTLLEKVKIYTSQQREQKISIYHEANGILLNKERYVIMTHTRYRYTCCIYLLRQTSNLISLVVATYSFYLHFSALYICIIRRQKLPPLIIIKLDISEVSSNESMLETCISSEPEPESLTSSK